MKFELNTLPRNASLEEIKQEVLRTCSFIKSEIITRKEFSIYSKVSTSMLIRKFGSWKEVLESCGIGHRYGSRVVSSKMKSQFARTLTNDELLSELKKVANSLKTKELSQTDFNNNSLISASVISRRFGTWENGLKQAGLQEVKMAKRYSEIEYFENLLKVWTHYGRQPFYREMNNEPSVISAGGYERKWGKWRTALEAFIEYVNNEKSDKDITTTQALQIIEKQNVPIIEKTERRDISLGLRYKVLSRDRFKCVKCGNCPSIDPKCVLHIDHIIPYSKGGKTIFENLQTTCDECNLGKGNKYFE